MVWCHVYLILGLHCKPFQWQMEPSRAVSLAPLHISIIFSAMLQDALRNCNSGAMIIFRSNGGIFNFQCLKARTMVLLRELLIAHTEDELQSILNDFARAASRYGLTISLTNTEVMLQLKLGSFPCDPVIKISDKQLKAIQTFCYLGCFLSQNTGIEFPN